MSDPDGAERVHTGQLRDEPISSSDLEVKAAIERLKEAAEKATKGEWIADNGEGFSAWTVWGGMSPTGHGKAGPLIATVVGDSAEADANAAYIAQANPSTILSLISSYEERGRLLKDASDQWGYASAAHQRAEASISQAQDRLQATREMLGRAMEELRLIRAKDCGAVYDTMLRTEAHLMLFNRSTPKGSDEA